MIITEYYKTRKDGVVLNKTYSSEGFYIERDGVKYSEAIDPEHAERAYTETSELIEIPLVEITENNAEEIAEKAMAYDILVGGQ